MVDQDGGAGRYRGTVALNIVLPDWPWELVLVALVIWEDCFTLRGTSAFDPASPFRAPSGWGLATDYGRAHAAAGSGLGGGPSIRWHAEFVPSLPDTATAVHVFAGPPSADPAGSGQLPHEPTVIVPLANWPQTPRLAEATNIGSAGWPHAPSDTWISSSLVDRAVRPSRVLPVSTQLDDGAGGDLCVLSLETWPSSFDLHVASGGRWGGASARDSSSVWERHRARWWARDDRGGEYWGLLQGGHSGSTSAVDVSFVPAVDPRADALTLQLPSPFNDENYVRSTIDLSTVASPA